MFVATLLPFSFHSVQVHDNKSRGAKLSDQEEGTSHAGDEIKDGLTHR